MASGPTYCYKKIFICVLCLETEVSPQLGTFFLFIVKEVHKYGSFTESSLGWKMLFFLHEFGIKLGNTPVARNRHWGSPGWLCQPLVPGFSCKINVTKNQRVWSWRELQSSFKKIWITFLTLRHAERKNEECEHVYLVSHAFKNILICLPYLS